LFVVLAVVAIITSFALPSFRNIMEKRQVTSGAEQVAAFISSAQLESVKRNEDITMSMTMSGDTWCVGFVSGTDGCDCTETDPAQADFCGVDGDGDGTIEADEQKVFDAAVMNHPEVMSAFAINDGKTILAFDPVRGLLNTSDADYADGATLQLTSTEGSYALNIMLNRTGRVMICSPDTDAYIPGYKSCP
jgi:type IV fimbrial biogenesis protein FimT